MGAKWDMGTCADCGLMRRVSHREWLRASQPRCRACGGRLEISSRARHEHKAHEGEARARGPRGRRKGDVETEVPQRKSCFVRA
jgi:hypothetical protein